MTENINELIKLAQDAAKELHFDEIAKRLNLVKPTEGSDFYQSYNSYWYDH